VGGERIIRFHQMWRCAAPLRKDENKGIEERETLRQKEEQKRGGDRERE